MAPTAEPDQPLRGMRILVVDDEFLIAATIEETLRDAGAEIVGAATVATALRAAENTSLSAAILDVRLGRQTSEPVADLLASRGVPFVFYSGEALPDSLRNKHPGAPLLAKPVNQSAFVAAVRDILAR